MLDNALRRFGIHKDHTDVWMALGVVPTGTMKEQSTAVQRRSEFARTLLTLADAQRWPEADVEQVDEATGRPAAAADIIQREVASSGGGRGLGSPCRRPCQELGTMGLTFPHTLRTADSVIGTQCSNRLGLTADRLLKTLPPPERRQTFGSASVRRRAMSGGHDRGSRTPAGRLCAPPGAGPPWQHIEGALPPR